MFADRTDVWSVRSNVSNQTGALTVAAPLYIHSMWIVCMCARIRISYMDSVTLRLRVVGVCLRAADTHTASGIQFYSSSFFTADHRSRSLAGCKCDRFGNAIRYTSRGRPHVVPLHSHGVRLCSAHTDTVPVVAIRICMAYIHIYAVRLWPRWLHSITVA